MMTIIAIIKNFIHDGWDGDMWSDDAGFKVGAVMVGLMFDALAIFAIVMLCKLL